MPPRKAQNQSPIVVNSQSPRKRSRSNANHETESETPSKRRRDALGADDITNRENADHQHESMTNGFAEPSPAEKTPTTTPRKRGRPPKPRPNGDTPTPRASDPRTPSKRKNKDGEDEDATPRRQAGADRSARRKSARALIESVVGNDDSDAEPDGIAGAIYDSSEEEAAGEDGDKTDATPSKDTPEKRGRKKRDKSPTPPRDLPSHELYFLHNKPGKPKTSNNTLSALSLLTHDEYFTLLREQTDRHQSQIEDLEAFHAKSFPQWTFELSQGFSICLYGYGSKRPLLQRLAKQLYQETPPGKTQRIVIVNGYAQTTTMRDILSTLGLALNVRIPAGPPPNMMQVLLASLASAPDTILAILVNSIDGAPIRKATHQATLAQLASHPQIRLIASADTPDFSLLWDVGLRSSFNFAFHDATTFRPFTVELDVVDDVHELLGRKARRINGREGVSFVLKSLPQNARNLFQLLVGEVLIAMEEEGVGGGEDVGVEYRMIYNKAVEEFICSSEMAFRTLLKEFHDHQIITSRKDAIGTELLSVPFGKEELEAILEDLMS
ncbi:uncharacterized protein J7T54_001259 [Emericellopsis cladophorae]|uniref:Origin recognition complex subunit 2 n=1 Tax=Emericellopsis cladophorae TaxID=2686198 RepID=A0A9Q0BDZ6_9HYPO|nr:uncharacterized protein J7T54_001259 [Emericellopsis cladophorae]KAI6782402.1 hypothetical protein J7T54_001259 [Emericellopsis cladophorae]